MYNGPLQMLYKCSKCFMEGNQPPSYAFAATIKHLRQPKGICGNHKVFVGVQNVLSFVVKQPPEGTGQVGK